MLAVKMSNSESGCSPCTVLVFTQEWSKQKSVAVPKMATSEMRFKY